MQPLRLCAPALRRFGLLGTATWWRPPPLAVRKGLGATATVPTLLFLFSAFVFVAFFPTLNNVSKVKRAVAVHSVSFLSLKS